MQPLPENWNFPSIRGELRNWILDVLADRQNDASVQEIREGLWSRIPAEVKHSWVILWVGDQISRTLHSLAAKKLVEHDPRSGLWRLYVESQSKPNQPPTRSVEAEPPPSLFV
jgi:hypothetical protein